MTNSVVRPGAVRAASSTVPPWRSTMRRVIDSPSPLPGDERASSPVTNGSKMCARRAGGMPSPLSATRITAAPFSSATSANSTVPSRL